MDRIQIQIDESKWTKMIKVLKHFDELKKKDDETFKDFTNRFTTIETHMRNWNVQLLNIWMAANLIGKN